VGVKLLAAADELPAGVLTASACWASWSRWQRALRTLALVDAGADRRLDGGRAGANGTGRRSSAE
jgi:hypothetical protein